MGNSDNPVSHRPQLARGIEHLETPNNIARKGAPKNLADVRIHTGMVTKSRLTGYLHFNGDALSRADANPAALGGPPAGKVLTAPQPVPGHRSRTSVGMTPAEFQDLGRRVLAEATCSPDDVMALGHLGVGRKP